MPQALDVFSQLNVSSKQQLVWSGLYEPFVASAKQVFASAEASPALTLVAKPVASLTVEAEEIAPELEISVSSPEWEAAEMLVLSAPPAMMLAAGAEPVVAEMDEEAAFHWQPILDALGADIAAEFDWVATTDTVETYEHRETHRYAHLDRATGEFLNQQCEVIPAENALAHARRPGTAVLQTQDSEPVAISAEAAPEAVAEPVLHAFTRSDEARAASPFWNSLAMHVESELDVFGSGVSSGLGMLLDTKRKLMARTPGWGAHLFSTNQETSDGAAAQDGPEPSFAAFTRRTSMP